MKSRLKKLPRLSTTSGTLHFYIKKELWSSSCFVTFLLIFSSCPCAGGADSDEEMEDVTE